MKPAVPAIHEVEPREKDGSKTSERYDFQYHQAAADALGVLDDTKVVCVYCDWHDDYVIEAAGTVRYRFHQVKTRTATQGAWTLNEFFGITLPRGAPRKSGPPKTPNVSKTSIFARMYDHVLRFGDRCEGFVFVTDMGWDNDLENLFKAVHAVDDVASVDPSAGFAGLSGPLCGALSQLTPDILFDFLRKLTPRRALGHLDELSDCRTIIGSRVFDLTEVELTVPEARRIAASLVDLVREKSKLTLNSLPASLAELRSSKGLVLDDVLRVLSLSSEGYRALRVGGKAAVIALSRLQRLFRKSDVDELLTVDFCQYKTFWDAWYVAQRHAVNPLDYIALKSEAVAALRLHVAGTLKFDGLGRASA